MTHAQRLKRSRLRVTPARMAILTCLEQASRPLTVAEIFNQSVQSKHKPDQATIYRILNTLVQKGLVKQIDFREGKYRYEIEGEHHHHLVCNRCGKITPIHEACVAISNETIQATYQFAVSEHHLEFFGLCSDCQST